MTLTDLEVPELGEGVDDDAEDDVQSNGRDEDKEGGVIYDEEAELGERVLSRVTRQTLQSINQSVNQSIYRSIDLSISH